MINQTSLLFREILHVENSFNLSEILNRLYAVLPPVIRRAAIPDDATATVILPDDLTVANKILYKNILLVPLELSTKKHLFASAIACITASYIAR